MQDVTKQKLVEYPRSAFYEIAEGFVNWLKFSFRTLMNLHYIFRYPGETFKQIYSLGNQALPLVIMAAMFVTMALGLEWGTQLAPFGAKTSIGSILTVAVMREIGPIVVGLIMAGRTGAQIASEIGNMVVTEQIDALRAFGMSPIRRLIVPRVFASLLVMAPLTIIADCMGILAGWLAVVTWLGVDPLFFWVTARDVLYFGDLVVGVIKPVFYGFLIGNISAYLGYTTHGGAEGLGKSTTRSVVTSSIGVLLLDFALTKILLVLIGVRY